MWDPNAEADFLSLVSAGTNLLLVVKSSARVQQEILYCVLLAWYILTSVSSYDTL
jgi:hypothetical protein